MGNVAEILKLLRGKTVADITIDSTNPDIAGVTIEVIFEDGSSLEVGHPPMTFKEDKPSLDIMVHINGTVG